MQDIQDIERSNSNISNAHNICDDCAYLSGLNPPQFEAVNSTEGAVLVLAGAGTGKTKVLTSRIVHILSQRKAHPSQILAVTFTNKAAREMVERVQELLLAELKAKTETTASPLPPHAAEEMTQGMWLGTFHSISARILRRNAERVGLTSSFTILDSDDQMRLVKTVMKDSGYDTKMYDPKLIYSNIQSWKDLGLTADKVTESHYKNHTSAISNRIYSEYQQRLLSSNACDFGDLLLYNLVIFRNNPEILQQYAEKFRYIMVDEYQDTNIAQYLWLRLLAAGHGNICCVGDDDQSIYGWRGAEVGNILRFEKDYENATIIRLEQNYRSTEHILAAASQLISHNRGRFGKKLWTGDSGGEKIRIKSTWDDAEEARFIGEEIENIQRRTRTDDGTYKPLKDIAVLVRAGSQTRALEERFLAVGIPYKVVGGLRFYERMEIRDAVAYLRLIMQEKDNLAFERIINQPRRGIGKTTLERIHIYAREREISLVQATRQMLQANSIKGKAKTGLEGFLQDLSSWQELANTMPPHELAEHVLEESGYMQMWRAEKSVEGQARLDNLKELVRALGEFPTVASFIEHIGLVSHGAENTGDNADNIDDMVSIMTLHAAKGLEFDTVFLTGWEEGLFPHSRSIDELGEKGVEEERRLAYVGITRAKRLLYITHAANRRVYNSWQSSIPSRFLNELPAEHIENLDNPDSDISRDGRNIYQKTGPQMFKQSIEDIFNSIDNKLGGTEWRQKNKTAEKRSYRKRKDPLVGKEVFHVKFGYGKVINVEGKNFEIMFKNTGKKKIQKDFIKFC